MASMGRGGSGAGGGGDGGDGRGGGNGERGERGGEASMLQLDAMKKLVLVQLILYGQVSFPHFNHDPLLLGLSRSLLTSGFMACGMRGADAIRSCLNCNGLHSSISYAL